MYMILVLPVFIIGILIITMTTLYYIYIYNAQNLSPQLPLSKLRTSSNHVCHVTWHPRFHGDSIARLQVAHLGSHGPHGAGAFVAHLTAVALVEAFLTSADGMGPKTF